MLGEGLLHKDFPSWFALGASAKSLNIAFLRSFRSQGF